MLTKSASKPSGVLPISHPTGNLFASGRRQVVASATEAFSIFETATLGDVKLGAPVVAASALFFGVVDGLVLLANLDSNSSVLSASSAGSDGISNCDAPSVCRKYVAPVPFDTNFDQPAGRCGNGALAGLSCGR